MRGRLATDTGCAASRYRRSWGMMIVPGSIPQEAEGIVVMALREARLEHVHYDGVITVEDVGMKDGLRIPVGNRARQLVLSFDDLDFDDRRSQVAREQHVMAAVTFARGFSAGRLLVHCHAGQCRSPALALAIIADRMGPGREGEAVDALLTIRPTSVPNLLVVALADRVLGRGGALKEAWAARERKSGLVGRVRGLRKLAWEESATGSNAGPMAVEAR